MTQIWPGFGEAPVPTLLSMICKPEAVVMVFPAVWANAPDGAAERKAPVTPIATATTSGRLRNRKLRICSCPFVDGVTGPGLRSRPAALATALFDCARRAAGLEGGRSSLTLMV